MTENDAIKRNLDLLNEFMKIAFDQPEILDKIPKGSELIILPENDPELYAANLKIKQSLEERGEKVVVVKMKKPETIPSPVIELTDVARNNV